MIGDRYTVKSGDCLWKIAREVLGAGNQWPRIWRYNNRREVVRITGRGIPNPDLIYPGQVLLIPRLPNTPRFPVASGTALPAQTAGQPGQSQMKGAGPTTVVKGPISAQLPDAQSPISIKYRLDDMKIPPIVQPGMIMEIQMTGEVVMMSRKKYPATYVTQRRELEIQAVHQANLAFGSLLSDTRLVYDDIGKKLTYRSMLVTQSSQPNSWATAVGVQMDSSSPLPKLRFEYRAPNPLSGSLPQHRYRAINVRVVIELTPKPDAPGIKNTNPDLQTVPVTQPITNWKKVIGTGFVIAGGVVVVGTIVEDFFTAGVGILDDAPSFAFASGLVVSGLAMIHGGSSSLPSASTPARVEIKVAMAASGSPENGKPRL